MSKTVAIYQDTENGVLRLGTFTARKHYSVRSISQQFMERHPNADASKLYIAFRIPIMGKYVDGERVPFDVDKLG